MFSSSKSGSATNGGATGIGSLGAKSKSIHSQLSAGKGVQLASGSSATSGLGGVLSLNGNVVGNLEHVFAAICGILFHVYEHESTWPDIFVRAYIDDSLGERNWVDSASCRTFVENIRTAFNTKSIPQQQQLVNNTTVASTPSGGTADLLSIGIDSTFNKNEDDANFSVFLLLLQKKIRAVNLFLS